MILSANTISLQKSVFIQYRGRIFFNYFAIHLVFFFFYLGILFLGSYDRHMYAKYLNFSVLRCSYLSLNLIRMSPVPHSQQYIHDHNTFWVNFVQFTQIPNQYLCMFYY